MPTSETNFIFAGRSIPGGPQQGVIYSLPFVAHVQRAIDAQPVLKGFFVSPEKFQETVTKFGIKVGAMTFPKARIVPIKPLPGRR
jgi:hypothetical protein